MKWLVAVVCLGLANLGNAQSLRLIFTGDIMDQVPGLGECRFELGPRLHAPRMHAQAAAAEVGQRQVVVKLRVFEVQHAHRVHRFQARARAIHMPSIAQPWRTTGQASAPRKSRR